jgi:hypothetical protein
LLQALQECAHARLILRVVRSCAPENTDAPHAFALLRPRGERPCGCRATECEYKLSSADVDCHLTAPNRIVPSPPLTDFDADPLG